MQNLRKAEATALKSDDIEMDDVLDITDEEAARAVRGIPKQVQRSMDRTRRREEQQEMEL